MTPSADIHIRHGVIGDLARIVAFNAAMARETESKALDPTTLAAGVQTALASPSANRRCRYYVAECDGQVVGQTMITFEWSDWRNGDFWWIQSVYVDPPYRRRGVFRALHQFIRSEARQDKAVCGLRLYAHDANQRALQTYVALGMTVTHYVVCEEDWAKGC